MRRDGNAVQDRPLRRGDADERSGLAHGILPAAELISFTEALELARLLRQADTATKPWRRPKLAAAVEDVSR
jgi:hypothetical protein